MCLYLDFCLPDTCSETVTTADDNMCGNHNKSSSITGVVLSCNAWSENTQSSIPVCNGEDSHNSEGLKNAEVSKEIGDSNFFEVTDKVIDKAGESSARNANDSVDPKREMPVLFQNNSAELENNSKISVNSDKAFGHTGNCGAARNGLFKDCEQSDAVLFSDIESSSSPSALEHENGKSSVMSSRTGDVSDSNHCNQACEGSKSHVHLFQDLVGDFQGLDGDREDSEAGLCNKSVDLEVQSDETDPNGMVCDVQMQQDDSLEPSGKSVEVEMEHDRTESSEKSTDVEMQNDENEVNEVSSDLNSQAGLNDSDELVGKDHKHDISGSNVKPDDQENENTEAEQGSKLDREIELEQSAKFGKDTEAEHSDKCGKDTEAEQGDKLGEDSEADQGDKLCKDTEVDEVDKLCNMEKGYSEADVWQAVSNDSENKVRALDEDNVLGAKASSEHNGTVSPEKPTPFIELEHAVENGKGNKILTSYKRTNQHVFGINCSM